MEISLKYFEIFSYPTFFMRSKWNDKSSPVIPRNRRVASLAWSVISFLLFVYHYSHTYWYTTVVTLIENSDPFEIFSRILFLTRTLFTFSLKGYLIYFSINYNDRISPLASYKSQFDAISHQILSGCKIESIDANKKHTRHVQLILFAKMIASTALIIAQHQNCFAPDRVNKCGFPYVTPLFDPINNAVSLVTQGMGISMLPILVSIVCMQFAMRVNQITTKLCSDKSILDHNLMQLIVRLFKIQSGLVKYLQSCLFFLMSFFAVSLISRVAMVAMQAKQMDWYSVIWIITTFSYASLVGYTSSMAGEAVSLSRAII